MRTGDMQKKRQLFTAPFCLRLAALPFREARTASREKQKDELIAAAQEDKDPENISTASASIIVSATDIESAASTSAAETAVSAQAA